MTVVYFSGHVYGINNSDNLWVSKFVGSEAVATQHGTYGEAVQKILAKYQAKKAGRSAGITLDGSQYPGAQGG